MRKKLGPAKILAGFRCAVAKGKETGHIFDWGRRALSGEVGEITVSQDRLIQLFICGA